MRRRTATVHAVGVRIGLAMMVTVTGIAATSPELRLRRVRRLSLGSCIYRDRELSVHLPPLSLIWAFFARLGGVGRVLSSAVATDVAAGCLVSCLDRRERRLWCWRIRCSRMVVPSRGVCQNQIAKAAFKPGDMTILAWPCGATRSHIGERARETDGQDLEEVGTATQLISVTLDAAPACRDASWRLGESSRKRRLERHCRDSRLVREVWAQLPW